MVYHLVFPPSATVPTIERVGSTQATFVTDFLIELYDQSTWWISEARIV